MDFSAYNQYDGPKAIFVTMEGCPHCIDFKPMVDDASNRVPIKIFEADDTFHSEIQRMFPGAIQGYPTLLYVHGDRVSIFDKQRTPQNVADWLAIEASRPQSYTFLKI